MAVVEEIAFDEVDLKEYLGNGSYATVRRGIWRKKDVAVKLFTNENERNTFIIEIRQLSQVDHANIIKLYSYCTQPYETCLVMELADGGSLKKVLHKMPKLQYTAAHAISWALQCAKGVAYLHGMNPKMIHRDLKPDNLLLFNSRRLLKICDFGTSCNQHTYMTNNRGSAAWMAPEVFEKTHYDEKCDVFSWGIILWEILSRKKPYEEDAIPFAIQWSLHKGTRPAPIKGCPKPIENLMKMCWEKNPGIRPSMAQVVKELSNIFKFFEGADEPLMSSSSEVCENEEDMANVESASSQSGDQKSNSVSKNDIKEQSSLSQTDKKRSSSFDLSSINIDVSVKKGHHRTGSYDSYYATKSTQEEAPKFVSLNKDQNEQQKLLHQSAPSILNNNLMIIWEENNRKISEMQLKLQKAKQEFSTLSDKKKLLQHKLDSVLNPTDQEILNLIKRKEELLAIRDCLKQRHSQSNSSDEWVVL